VKPCTRAFFGVALFWLAFSALLHVLVAIGVSGAWGAMVHALLFGWITNMIAAVNYQTMPVFAARDFPSQRTIWAHWMSLASGLATTAAGMLLALQVLVVAGLLLECGAALLFLLNVVQLFRRGAPRPRAATPPIVDQPQIDRLGTQATKASGLCLPLALVFLLASRLGWSGEWALAAEHMATLGWVMLMIVGVGYHVLPRFSGVGVRGVGWARAQLACHLGALLLMVPALAFGWGGLFAIGGVLMAAALGLFAWTVWPTLQPIRLRPGAIPLIVKERAP
jgi:hypothetical protein